MSAVLDASAVLALLNEEPGGDAVADVVENARICTVNSAEVGGKLIDAGMSSDEAREAVKLLLLDSVPLDDELAHATAALRSVTKSKGLSLGDRACLALAIRENAVAVTADRKWAELDIGCDIQVIRP